MFSGQPRARQTPVFQSWPRGTGGQAGMPTDDGFTASQTSMYGWPTTSACRAGHRRRDPGLLRAGHQVVDEDAEAGVRARARSLGRSPADRRCPPGTPRRRPRCAGRRPRPARPARRRAGPPRRCAPPAPPGPGHRARRRDPDAVRAGRSRRAALGRTRVTTRPSSRKPRGSMGNTRCLPKRSSRVTVGPCGSSRSGSRHRRSPVRPPRPPDPGSAGTSGAGLLLLPRRGQVRAVALALHEDLFWTHGRCREGRDGR